MIQAADSVADNLLARLPCSPDAYPQKIDLVGLAVLLIEWSREGYRAASFLDDRILTPGVKGAWFPLDRVAEAARLVGNPRPLHFIFHTGHVGSTLVSRLLDQTGNVLSLREPLPLRSLADSLDVLGHPDSLLSELQFDHVLALFLKLWTRGYEATRAVIVKATSSAGRLASRILTGSQGSRAIQMNVGREPYLATLLAGQNSAIDLRGHGPERIRRLQVRTTAPMAALTELSIGELAALSWLVESWTQRDAASSFAGRILTLDFETFLAGPEEGMRQVLLHFALPGDERYVAGIERSAAMTRYSKAPEHAYTPALRAEVLREARRDHREEIRKGLHWLDRMAGADPAIAAIVNA